MTYETTLAGTRAVLDLLADDKEHTYLDVALTAARAGITSSATLTQIIYRQKTRHRIIEENKMIRKGPKWDKPLMSSPPRGRFDEVFGKKEAKKEEAKKPEVKEEVILKPERSYRQRNAEAQQKITLICDLLADGKPKRVKDILDQASALGIWRGTVSAYIYQWTAANYLTRVGHGVVVMRQRPEEVCPRVGELPYIPPTPKEIEIARELNPQEMKVSPLLHRICEAFDDGKPHRVSELLIKNVNRQLLHSYLAVWTKAGYFQRTTPGVYRMLARPPKTNPRPGEYTRELGQKLLAPSKLADLMERAKELTKDVEITLEEKLPKEKGFVPDPEVVEKGKKFMILREIDQLRAKVETMLEAL